MHDEWKLVYPLDSTNAKFLKDGLKAIYQIKFSLMFEKVSLYIDLYHVKCWSSLGTIHLLSIMWL